MDVREKGYALFRSTSTITMAFEVGLFLEHCF